IPSFCGKGNYGIIPHQKALEYGVKITGATVHFVDPEYDSGPIIFQRAVEVSDDDTPETLQRKVMEQAEWILLPKAILLFSQGKLKVEGRKVRILP
ncbi:MAG: phosphoribosylglycinamide formyltransferase, partial [Clostridiaceae bacterium]|nr:phosphoribosylglycinamide formyltransferase [Clostridiaceae bacterium]